MLKSHKGLPLWILLLCSLSTSVSAEYSDVERTWFYGKHAIPASITQSGEPFTIRGKVSEPVFSDTIAEMLIPNKKVPAILFLHGCRGIQSDDKFNQRELVKLGYAVFMIDSFKRPDRLACKEQGELSYRVSLRKEEIQYAHDTVKLLPWIDAEKVILMGFSEGANAVDNWKKLGFQAHIIIASACTLNWGSKPKAPEGVEVLAIVGEKDKYRPGKSCKLKYKNQFSQSIVLPKFGHQILAAKKTQALVADFLKKLNGS